jgi:hypothetical protein
MRKDIYNFLGNPCNEWCKRVVKFLIERASGGSLSGKKSVGEAVYGGQGKKSHCN